jgi:6-phosphogluconolactonase
MRTVKFYGIFLWAAASLWPQNTFLYTNNNTTFNTVSGFLVQPQGNLIPLPGSPFPTQGNGAYALSSAPLIVATATPAKNFLYAANFGSGTITGFLVDRTTGNLTMIPGSPFPSGLLGTTFGVGALAITPDDQYLIISSPNGNRMAVSYIGPTGELLLAPGSPFTTPVNFFASQLAALGVTPDNKFVALGMASTYGTGVLTMFTLQPGGVLVPIPGFTNTGLLGGIDFSCANNRLYVSHRLLNQTQVNAYSIGPTGLLTPLPGTPFSGFGANAWNVLLSPDNANLFVSNLGSSNLASFNVTSNGGLQPVSGSPFPAGGIFPASLTVNRLGTFLYSANIFSGTVAGFRINPFGVLSPVPGSPFFLGTFSSGFSVAAFPPKTCIGFRPL